MCGAHFFQGVWRAFRSHFGSSHFLFERARCFSRSRAFLVLSCPSVYNPVLKFPSSLMARMGDGANVPISSPPASFSNFGFSNSAGSDLDGTATRPGITTDEKLDALLSKFVHFETQIAQIPAITTWMSRMDSHITKTLGDFATRLAAIEQNFSTFSARLWKVETYAASASHVSGSARSWPSVEQVDGSTAARSHGPGSSGANRNTRRRLDTFSSPEDEHARSAVLLRFPCEQYHKGITKWIDNLWEESNMPVCNKPVRIHCKAGSGLFLKRELNVKTLLHDTKMMVFLMRLTVPSAAPIQISLSVNPNQLRTESSENNLRLCGENWLTNSEFSSLMEVTKVLLSSQHSILAHRSSASKIEETDLENQFSNLLRLGADKHSPLLHLICVFLVFLMKYCSGFSLKPTGLMCDGRLFASPLFRRLAGRGDFFCGFPFRWVLHFVFCLIRGVALHESPSCSREDSLNECGRPCDALSCLFFSALWLRCNFSILVLDTQTVKDLDLTCFTMSLFGDATCPQVGPMSLDWPVNPFSKIRTFQIFPAS